MINRQSASMEDYLEAVVFLLKDRKKPTITNISSLLGVKKPSVTAAVTKLAEQGLVEHEKYGMVKLTGDGLKIARDVSHRHNTLRQFLVEILKVPAEVAGKDACHMEHLLSKTSLDRLSEYTEFILKSPSGMTGSLKYSEHFFTQEKSGGISDIKTPE
ncbi:MAG: metal-dependent transcriptional regulator [Dehalococcoidales bacterium]|nr:metal-dependent transcriptional regulator [Dehalococcoidales bacterium]